MTVQVMTRFEFPLTKWITDAFAIVILSGSGIMFHMTMDQ